MSATTTTIKDVAREAGVNISTVSRALNDGYGVHPKTRERVLAVALRLAYRPNRVARGLVTGRSHSLALIVSDIRNPFFADIARGAEDAARAAGCDLILCNSDLDPAKQMDYVRSLLEKRIDGILMNTVAALDRRQQEALAVCGVPIVLLNRSASSRAFSTVCADNEAGGALAAQYLIRLGHRRIAHLTGPRHHGNMTDRVRGFLRGFGIVGESGGAAGAAKSAANGAGAARRFRVRATAAGPAMEGSVAVLYGENSFAGGRALAEQVLRRHPSVTAIFAANDVMAFGALRTLHEAGRRVPADISVIGFDDVEMAAVVQPPLTTIHQPKYEIGHAAVETLLLLRRDGDQRAPEHLLLGVSLVERESCKVRA
jgi:DNA-binding LacI/PurR family transcriptional regulator